MCTFSEEVEPLEHILSYLKTIYNKANTGHVNAGELLNKAYAILKIERRQNGWHIIWCCQIVETKINILRVVYLIKLKATTAVLAPIWDMLRMYLSALVHVNMASRWLYVSIIVLNKTIETLWQLTLVILGMVILIINFMYVQVYVFVTWERVVQSCMYVSRYVIFVGHVI